MYTFNGENAKIIYTESNCFDFLDFEQPKILKVLKIEGVDKDACVNYLEIFNLLKNFLDENNDKLILCDYNLPYVKLEYVDSKELYDHYCKRIVTEIFCDFNIVDISKLFDDTRSISRHFPKENNHYYIYVNECFGKWLVNVRKHYFKSAGLHIKTTYHDIWYDWNFKNFENSIESSRLREEKSVKEKYGAENVYLDDNGLWRIKATDYIVSEGYCHAKQFNV